jgi:hypothetical protein
MGVVSACAFSFMSKYLHQSCGPKPMTRVDINDNNQSSNMMTPPMMTHSGREYTLYLSPILVIFVASPKWSIEGIFGPLDLANIQARLHDLPEEVDSWIPKLLGEVGYYGKTH